MNKPREVRTVSATGGAKGAKDIRLGGADAAALVELGRVYGMGEKKYARFNYLKGYPWSLSIDAMLRHLLAFMGGQEYDECTVHPGQHGDEHAYDPEVCDGSGLLHTAHVAWHGLTLTAFQQRGVGEDDRFVEHDPVTAPVTAPVITYEPWGAGDGTVYGMPRSEWERQGRPVPALVQSDDILPDPFKKPE